MDEKKLLISVVTVVFNGADYLEQAILSVVNQGYENIEYIVIDGGSTDGTLDIIHRYRDKIAYFVSEPDEGIFNAMNKGVAQTNGDFIGILNADDWYEPGIINRVVDKINESQETPPGPDVIYFDYYHFDEELSTHRKVKRYSSMAYWRGMSISHQAMFVSKGVYEK
ncbi:MAG: glycosyltransferase, partial [bacterium]|nr:glycosyltransferase [bacterium]